MITGKDSSSSIKPTSFYRRTAKDSSSSIRSLAAARSSSFSYLICCAKPKPMHLKGESEPLDLAAFFSDLFDEELMLWVKWPSGFTCSTMPSNALNCFQNFLKYN